ncbi:MAG: hypothetical protein LBI73_11420 [Myroides sp.]|jgi:hypothetical protein|nr:hypothetical protein [Myroides sp.]
MERRLRLYYFALLPIVLAVIFLLVKKGSGMLIGSYINFFLSGLPFLLLNISRSVYKGKKIVDMINIGYITLILIYGIIVLKFSDWLILVTVYLPFGSLLAMEFFYNKTYLLLNIMSLVYLVIFLGYVI